MTVVLYFIFPQIVINHCVAKSTEPDDLLALPSDVLLWTCVSETDLRYDQLLPVHSCGPEVIIELLAELIERGSRF